ncbi:MAG: Universal stress protein [Methanosaeta sp. PtaU1.Bin112]|nr:MAG: Universal stress protein [Methanosaeta sp. PtaU1.Bin112]
MPILFFLIMINRIMIATDGSDASRKAAKIAVDIARRANGSITAVYVMDTERLSHLPGFSALPELKEKAFRLIQDEGQQALQFVEDQATAETVPFRKILAQGSPGKELIKISREQEIDLLVMGSMGRTGVEKILLGSVAGKVVLQSSIPTLLVK